MRLQIIPEEGIPRQDSIRTKKKRITSTRADILVCKWAMRQDQKHPWEDYEFQGQTELLGEWDALDAEFE